MTRLVDMGIEPYLVASSLEMVLAQRLVRIICPHCREAFVPDDLDALRTKFGDPTLEVLHRGVGCRQCQGSGYLGRTGIFEVMTVSEAIRAMILERASASQIRRQAAAEGMMSLREDGWRLVKSGKTTLAEVLRVTKDERFHSNSAPAGSDAAAP